MPLETDARPPSPQTARKVSTNSSSEYEIERKEVVTLIKKDNEGRFVERKEFLLAPLEYARDGTDPGLVLIFNQESFEDKNFRLGSRRDVNEIILCMGRLGFNVSEEHVFTDYNRDDIINVIQKIVNSDLSNFNSLILFFLTHGDNFNILHAHDLSLQTHEIWELFGQCKQLENKPKMFVFQACKGENFSTTANSTATVRKTVELVSDKTFKSNYIGPDMLIVYSTTEGNVSFRDPKNGTWFIQELCKNFLAYGRRDDVISLVMRTGKCLARNYYHHEKNQIKKQMPILISTLRKKFYLNKSKERHTLLSLAKDQEDMANKIQDLEKKVDELIQDKEKRNKETKKDSLLLV